MTASMNADGNLEVYGPPASQSNIWVNTSNPAAVVGNVNGAGFGPFDVSASGKRVIVRGGSVRDVIQVAGHLPCEIHGQGGSDRLYGSEGGSVIFAVDGGPLLVGGAGVNVLVGGTGGSVMQNVGGGLMLAGTTSMSYDELRQLADAFAADPAGTDLSSLQASFTPHTAGQAHMSGSTTNPNAFLGKAGDIVTNQKPGDVVFLA